VPFTLKKRTSFHVKKRKGRKKKERGKRGERWLLLFFPSSPIPIAAQGHMANEKKGKRKREKRKKR